ncbi:MAG: hypothetical protein ABH952_00535 [Candidatus Omnitrophota bacterium]
MREKIFKKLSGVSGDMISSAVIISPFISVKKIARHLHNSKFFKGALYEGVIGRFAQREITYIKTGIGASLIGDAVLSLPDKKYAGVYFLGAVGGINKLNIAELVIVKQAKADGGFVAIIEEKDKISTAISYCPDKRLLAQGIEFLKKNIQEIRQVNVATLSSLFFETKQNICRMQKMGIEAVDMELAAFYAAAKKRGIPALGLCFVSDLPGEMVFWDKISIDKLLALSNVQKRMIKAGLKIAAELTVNTAVENNRDEKDGLCFKNLTLWPQFSKSEQSILESIIRSLGLGRNKAAVLIELLFEIGERENISREKILEDTGFSEILTKGNVSRERKFELLTERLRSKRFPEYFKQKKRLEELVKRLNLPKYLRIDTLNFFENKKLNFNFYLNSPDMLIPIAMAVKALSTNPALKEIFDEEKP